MNMSVRDALIYALNQYQREHGLNQTQLAQLLGVGMTSISEWYSYIRKPNLENGYKIMKLLHEDGKDIFKELG